MKQIINHVVIALLIVGASANLFAAESTTLGSLEMAHAYLIAGMHKDAVLALKKFDPATEEQVSQLNYALGKIYLAIDQPIKAQEYFSSVLEQDAQHGDALMGMAEVQIKLGRVDLAREYLARSNQTNQRRSDRVYLQALCSEVTGDAASADRILKADFAQYTRDGDAVVNIARMQLQRGSTDQAVAWLEQQSTKRPESAQVLDLLADLLHGKKKSEAALVYKRRAADLYLASQDRVRAQAVKLKLNDPSWQVGQWPGAIAKNDNSKIELDRKAIKSAPEYSQKSFQAQFSKFPFPAGTQIRGGSGVTIENGQKIITNRHVVEGGKDIAVRNGVGLMSKAHVIYMSQTDDLAVLELEQPFPLEHSFNLNQAQQARPGSDVVVMGYPLWYILGSATPSITNGVVAKATGFNEDPSYFQMTAKVNKGNSGGPVFDLYGNLVGITQGKLDIESIQKKDGFLPEDINFAIHIERIQKIFQAKPEVSAPSAASRAMRPEEIYQTMIGKVVMVAVAVD